MRVPWQHTAFMMFLAAVNVLMLVAIFKVVTR